MDQEEQDRKREEHKEYIEQFRKERKEMKKRAHKTVRSHYAALFIICLIMMTIGLEFGNSLSILDTADGDKAKTGSGIVAAGSASDVLDDIVSERLAKGDKTAKKNIEKYRKSTKKGDVLGRRNGVIANLVNNLASGGFYVQIVSAIRNIFHSTAIATTLFVILALLFSFVFFVFVRLTMRVVGRRMFLEASCYEKVPAHHFMWLWAVHKWHKASITILVETVFGLLWSLTIIGGIIKMYSYYQVSFIVAENPDIDPLKAITLSRKMMDGHKWERFKIDVTLFGWVLLSAVTAGLSDLFYGNQYRLSIDCEYYSYVRKLAKEKKVEDADLLNDKYLFEHAPEEVLWKKYYDVDAESKYVEEHAIKLTGIRKFFVDNFGIWFGSSKEKKDYQDVEGRKYIIRREKDILEGLSYPTRLNQLADPKQNNLSGSVSFLRCYTVWSIILMFFMFAFAGWVWEVSLHLVTDGTFVNRGMLHGPWLPIYGYGGTLILVLLTRFRKNILLEFVLGIVLAGIVEFMTSWVLEMTKGMKWWDYSGYFLNIQGRICAEGLLVFGIAGLIVVYALAPFADNLIEKIPGKTVVAICVALLTVFAADQIYSNKHPNVGEGITAGPAKTDKKSDTASPKAYAGIYNSSPKGTQIIRI